MAVKKEESCCCSGMGMCSMCGWATLVWGVLLVLAGMNYLPPILNGWVLLGLGLGIWGLMAALKIGKH